MEIRSENTDSTTANTQQRRSRELQQIRLDRFPQRQTRADPFEDTMCLPKSEWYSNLKHTAEINNDAETYRFCPEDRPQVLCSELEPYREVC